MKRSRHTWSLGQELATIELAARGCAVILTQVTETHGDERTAKELASQAEAMVTLVHLRLRDLGRLLRGELAPWVLAGPHNVAPPNGSRTNPGEDVVFAPVGDERALRVPRPPSR